MKRALVVGINAYPAPNTLPSCVNDANAFADLVKSNYQFEAIANLRDDQATRAGILDGLASLVSGAQSGDELVFYYSGHGYSFQQGDAMIDSLVGQDCNFLTVQDFNDTIKNAPQGALTVVLDSCFSGGMQKAFARMGGVKLAQVKFFQPVVPAQQMKVFEASLPALRTSKRFGSTDTDVAVSAADAEAASKAFSIVEPAADGVDRRFILLSACLGTETAAASTERTNGMSAFTFSLLSQIAVDGTRASVAALVEDTGQMLRKLGVKQTPMLKAPSAPADLIQHPFLLWDVSVPELQGSASPSLATATPPKYNGKGADMTTSLDFSSDIESIVRATLPTATASIKNFGATKDFPAPNGADKAWFDDLTRIVATAIPAVLQGMKTMPPAPSAMKGFSGGPQPFDKGWFDSLVSVATQVVPVVIDALKKDFKPTDANSDLVAAAQKGWFDDVTHVVANVLPIVLSAVKAMPPSAGTSKGYDPLQSASNVDEKSFWSTLGQIAQVAVPIALAAI